jgi:hypothetical protein
MRHSVKLMTAVTLVVTAAAGHAQRTPVVLSVAGRTNQAVSIAAHDRQVAVSWIASSPTEGSDAFMALSLDDGVTFMPPVRINSTPGDASGSGEMPPRVVFSRDARGASRLVAVWAAKREGGTRLLSAESLDGGRSFTASRVIAASVGAGNRGWQSVSAAADGRVHVLWLDHRDVPPAAHRHGASTSSTAVSDPDARAAPSKLYFATIGDTAAPRVITGSVCYCCKTSLSTTGTTIFGAWRHVFPGSERDIALTVSRDGGRQFSPVRRVHADQWVYGGCPDDGPTTTVTDDGAVHVVWPSPRDGVSGSPMALFHVDTHDGIAMSPRTTVPVDGIARHVTSAAMGDALLLSWDESTPSTRYVVVARTRRTMLGRTSFDRRSVNGSEGGSYPAIAVSRAGGVVAWVVRQGERSVIQVGQVRWSSR